MVAVDSHWSIAMPIVDFRPVGAVNWNLLIAGAQSVPVSVRVGEEPALQHFIGGGFHAGHEVTWRKCGLLGLSKVVVWISVQDHGAHWDQWIVLLRNHFGDIENIPFITVPLFLRDCLDKQVPFSSFALIKVFY